MSAIASRWLTARPLRTLVACAIIAGCGSSDQATGPIAGATVHGRYSLQSINGSSLPIAVTSSQQLLSHILVITPMNTFADTASIRSNATGLTTIGVGAGTVGILGSAITLTSSETGGVLSATWDGGTQLTVTSGLGALRFVKQ